jgi:hypothetical protein
MEERVEKLENIIKKEREQTSEIKTPEVAPECSHNVVTTEISSGEASETTIPSVSELTDSIKSLSGERNILKFLCNKLFTQNEIINCSRTGKKNPSKSGDTVKPALNQEKFGILEQLILKHTTYDKNTFHKKFENQQKCAIRDKKSKPE